MIANTIRVLDTVPTNLSLTLLPKKAFVRIAASGAFLSYPAWLLAGLTDLSPSLALPGSSLDGIVAV